MKKGNIILLVLSSIYTLVIEYMFYPEYIRYQEAGGLFLMTNDYLQGYLLAPTGMEQSDNELFVSILPSALTGTFRGNRFTFDYRSHPPPLLKAMESSTARMDNHRTDHHVLHLSICLELIRTITIQSIPFDTRFLSFHPEQSNTLYQRFDRYSFLISSFTGKLLTFIVSVWNCFRTNFLQTKRLPYVTGYKSGTCCRMASVMAKLCFLHPGQSAVHIH